MIRSIPQERRRSLLDAARIGTGFALGYFLLDRVSFIYPLHEFNITPWDPQPALAIALLYLRGWRWVPWIFATVLFSEFLSRDLSLALPTTVLLTSVLVGGHLLVAWAMRGPLEVTPRLGSRQDLIRMAAAIVVGSGANGLCYVAILCGGDHLPWSWLPSALFRYWLGDSIGLLVTLPLLLFLAEPLRREELRELARTRGIVLPFALVVAALAVVFLQEESRQYKFFYLLFVPIIWIAARYGLAGALSAVAMIQAGIVVSVVSSDHQIIEVLELQTLLLCLVLTGLVLGAAVDEWRDASQRLARSQQLTAVGEMATALAHELNQPLTALSTYSDAMRLLADSGTGDRSAIRETAERIRRVATRCAQIVKRFRGLAPNRAPHTERTDLADTVKAAVDALRERLDQTRTEVVVRAEGKATHEVLIDRERMEFVFQNLLANAIDAACSNDHISPRVEITIRRDGRTHVRATVHDSGPGIPANRVEKIFEPFFTQKANGMGLGLALCRSIVESHDGRVWAEAGTAGMLHVRLPL